MEAALIGMIPEGLYLLTTVALALAAMKLARKEVMLHDMKSVETLARVNVLCVDKTGTITEPKMAVEKIVNSKAYSGDLDQVIANFAKNMPADNATMKAIHAHFKNGTKTATSILPFTSVNKYSGVIFGQQTILIGAPEMVLRDQYEQYQDEFEKYAAEGYRVLLVATYPGVLTEESSTLKEKVKVLGYILLSNPIRKEAKSTFQYFAKQGVDIKVISGDNPVTVARVAKQAGINGADKYIDAQTIKDGKYEKAVQEYNVFGRVKPEQKRKFVVALQNQGSTVAMTGDGVNEGRQVVNNIQRSASLFLVKNIFSFLMAIFALIMTINYPLQPAQITLISAFTIGLPSFLLALETNHQRIRGQFMPNVLARAIPGGLTDWLAVAILVIAGSYISLDHGQVGTTATTLLVLVGLMVMYHISAPMNKFRLMVMGLSILCIIGSVIFLPHLFSLTMLNNKPLFILMILFFAAVTIFRWLSKVLDGVAEVLIVFDQKGKNMTFAEFKEAYDRGKKNIK